MIEDQIILGIDPGTNVMGYGLIQIKQNQLKMLNMGVFDLQKESNPYRKLQIIFNETIALIDKYQPKILAIEAPFFGKNVQSMLKLGRAQGVAISAALYRNLSIFEYAPLKIKMAITGNGRASKEQVADMIQRFLKIPNEKMSKHLDATDGLAAAYCHYLQLGKPVSQREYKSWKDFVAKNESRVKK
ncbi:MAG: crossover junction endodeoxyribonuclease RuvC [Paludibacter sp.]|nr:MAG: crossover junction endodeoxyribonuclease RuvC [Paludibacter sp.]